MKPLDARTRDMEEALGIIYHCRERNLKDEVRIKNLLVSGVSGSIYETLLRENYVVASSGSIEMTRKGEETARAVTRRHRLAERLLADVLDLSGSLVDENACEFEHIISEEVADSICTLLGHPRQCPHGSPIPSGKCCGDVKTGERPAHTVESLVMSLTELKPGETARVAYLHTNDHAIAHRLLSLGVVPGAVLKLEQTEPTYVVQAGETTLALEESLAQGIFVRQPDRAL